MSSFGNNVIEAVKWMKVEVDAFVAAMVEEVKKGNKTTSTFNKHGWNAIKAKLETRFGRTFTGLQLRNKMNKLRADYGSFKKLLEQSGFNWNHDIRACEVTDESVWDRHIKENPTWMKFKKNGLPQWPELQIIFGDSYASGVGAISSGEEHNLFHEIANLDSDFDGTQPSPGVGNSETELRSERVTGHRLDRTPDGKWKKAKNTELVGAIREMCEVSRARLQFMNITNAGSSTSAVEGYDYTINHCISVLDSMPYLDKDQYTKAVMKSIESSSWREGFIPVPMEKKIWLIEMLE